MKATNYDDLDNAICEHIRSGNKLSPIHSGALQIVARMSLPEPWRLIDRRMQAMRRAGRLRYECKKDEDRCKWHVIDETM